MTGRGLKVEHDRRRAVARGLVTGLLVLSSPEAGRAGTLAAPGCLDGGDPAVVARIDPALDLGLADGREIHLPGLDAVSADDKAGEPARGMLAGWLVGRSVLVRPLTGQPDRWGRTVALVFATAPGAEAPSESGTDRPPARVALVEALLDAGLARARPDPATARCWADDLAAEGRAREARLGVWAEPRNAVLAADDRAALAGATARMAIVEGRIARHTEGRARLYLAFGPGGRTGFAIAVERRVVASLRAAGHDPAGWPGRHVRVRGFLDDRFGLQIELTSLDQIEFIEP